MLLCVHRHSVCVASSVCSLFIVLDVCLESNSPQTAEYIAAIQHLMGHCYLAGGGVANCGLFYSNYTIQQWLRRKNLPEITSRMLLSALFFLLLLSVVIVVEVGSVAVFEVRILVFIDLFKK